MDELIKQMNIAMKSTRESGFVIGDAMKSVLKKLKEGGN